MNKTKIVKTKILPLLLEMGFLYHKDVKSWWFTRKIGEVEQYVVLVDLWQSNLRLEFFSNEYQAKTIEGANLIEKKEEYQIEIGKGIAYETEEEFETIIEEYKRVIQQHLESCFKEISSEITEIRPTKEMELYLFENHKDLIEAYQKKYNLLHASYIETIDSIVQVLKELEAYNYKEIQQELVGIAAVFGQIMIEELNGEWYWEEEVQMTVINLNNHYKSTCTPLNDIVFCWREKSYDYLKEIIQGEMKLKECYGE